MKLSINWTNFHGRPAENGNYIIVVRAVSLYGQEIELNGPVTLVR